MTELLDKLSSYNIFNYLLPGILFAVIGTAYTSYDFVHDDVVVGLFVYYFIGLVISRIGSLAIEPFLKWIAFLKFAEYSDFIEASKHDPKIEELSEANNTYRTLCSLFIFLLGLFLYEAIARNVAWVQVAGPYVLIALLFLLFLFAYRKQTNYVVRRINKVLGDK